jgi:regulator of sigma E protease
VPPEQKPYSFKDHPLWHRFLIVLAGPGFNFLFAMLSLFVVFAVAGIPYLTTEIGGVKPDSPAALAGLQKGDLILTVDREPVQRWDDLSNKIRQFGERPLELEVKRGEAVLKLSVVPQRMETSDIFGGKVSAVLIGISAGENPAVEQVGPLRALEQGVTYTFRLLRLTLMSLYKLLAREMPLKSLGGPILIAQVAGKQAELGASYLVHFMAVLSVNLALLNLLPIPILDGGHLFFFLVEAIRRKPVPVRHREVAQALGLMMILALMILVFYQDFLRLLNPQH